MSIKSESLDISAVVCCWNSIKSIKECLQSLKNNHVKEIIVVDANSTDGTRQIAQSYTKHILSDPREGLAVARNIGIKEAQSKYVINVGVDNIMPSGSINRMISYLERNNYTGVSAVTLLHTTKGEYFTYAMNNYKIARFYPGERAVIGTPTVFLTAVLKENPYDPKMSWSDDGDLCTRLSKIGGKFAISDIIVYEIGSEDIKSIFYRWKGYGKSDWETFRKYSPTWSLSRKWFSLTYPFRNELLYPFIRIPGIHRFKTLPFLWLVTSIRYFSWLKFSITKHK